MREHTVQRGETLSSIATKYGVTWQGIQQVNGLSNPNLIGIGQKLKIPDVGGAAGAFQGGLWSGGSWSGDAPRTPSPYPMYMRKPGSGTAGGYYAHMGNGIYALVDKATNKPTAFRYTHAQMVGWGYVGSNTIDYPLVNTSKALPGKPFYMVQGSPNIYRKSDNYHFKSMSEFVAAGGAENLSNVEIRTSASGAGGGGDAGGNNNAASNDGGKKKSFFEKHQDEIIIGGALLIVLMIVSSD